MYCNSHCGALRRACLLFTVIGLEANSDTCKSGVPHFSKQTLTFAATTPVLPGLIRISAASGGGFTGDEVVTFGLGVRLDRSQVGPSRRRLSRLHFDFSEGEARIEFDAHITHPRDFVTIADNSLLAARAVEE